jgi:hypothetical protein
MTVGFRNAAGQDADDIYDPDVKADGGPAIGFRNVSGQNIHYANSKYGQPGGALGCGGSGVADYGPTWSKAGTAVYAHVIANPNWPVMSSSYVMTGALQYQATTSIEFDTDGTLSVLNSNSGTGGTPRTAQWFDPVTSGIGPHYEMLLTYTPLAGSSAATITNNATNWIAISSGLGFGISIQSTRTVQKQASGSLRIQIRDATTKVVQLDNTINVSVSLQQL